MRCRTFGLVVALGLAGLCAGVQAQESREREMLRRTQAALREAQAAQDALRAQLAQLQGQQQSAANEAAALRSRLGRLEAERRSGQARLDEHQLAVQQLTSALDAQRRQADDAAARQAQALAACRRQGEVLQAERDERTAANSQLVALLQARTASESDLQRRLEQMHALSSELVRRWLRKTPAEALGDLERVSGVGSVRAEDQAERWRAELDALRAAPTASQ